MHAGASPPQVCLGVTLGSSPPYLLHCWARLQRAIPSLHSAEQLEAAFTHISAAPSSCPPKPRHSQARAPESYLVVHASSPSPPPAAQPRPPPRARPP